MQRPRGVTNFRDIIDKGYLYIDKTSYIETLEETGDKYPFFVRRIGKSLSSPCRKTATAKSPSFRIFITGIPVMPDHHTGGYNISANLTANDRFNGIMGFREKADRFLPGKREAGLKPFFLLFLPL